MAKHAKPVWRAFSLFLVGIGLFAAFGAAASTTERVVVDVYTGLAIEGYDPVAYFITRAPVQGRAEFEASRDGAVWRFVNVGNKEAYLAHPEIYGPKYGGHDPMDVVRGKAVDGHPLIWAISDTRLFLFANEANRMKFLENPERWRGEADARWPDLLNTLGR